MWSKEHKKLARRGWSETEIQAHFKEREVIEYQRYNQLAGSFPSHPQPLRTLVSRLDMQMDSPDPSNHLATER